MNAVTKSKAGRPSRYDPAYCEAIVEAMSRGFSKTAFAGMIGVHRDTLQEWAKAHPDFHKAAGVGTARRCLFFEGQLLDAVSSGRVMGSSTLLIFALKNCCPAEWRDVHKTELTGAGTVNQALTIEFVDAEAVRQSLESKIAAALQLIADRQGSSDFPSP